MRLRITLLLLILSIGYSQELAAQESAEPIYTVQISTFLQSSIDDFTEIADLGFIYSQNIGPNLYRIYLGGYRSKADADQKVAVLQKKGYIDAMVQQIDLSQGNEVRVIQLGVKIAGQVIDWASFTPAGNLYALQTDRQVKIMTGIYPDYSTALVQLEQIRKLGYKDAFIKTVNSALLHAITEFHLGKMPAGSVVATPRVEMTPKTPIKEENRPDSYETDITPPGLTGSRVTTGVDRPTVTSRPEIRGNIKRNSALELQRLLQNKGAYRSSLDGYYGSGTLNAFELVSEQNNQIQKYSTLAEQQSTKRANYNSGGLQYYINILPDQPQVALDAFAESFVPVGKAYRAYWIFNKTGPSLEVNNLMNTAIREAYANRPGFSNARFDHTATYTYQSLTQVLRHLRYIQAASGSYLSAPCWIFSQHPEAAAQAFEPDPLAPETNVNLQGCGGFLDWKELKILLTMAKDISSTSVVNNQRVTDGQTQQANYFMAPRPLDAATAQSTKEWEQKLMTGMTGWGGRDALLGEMAEAFKMVYYQSEVLLEDYFMDKGLKSGEASPLARATLQAIVGPYLERFM